MYRNGTNGIVNLELALDPVVEFVSDPNPNNANQERLQWVIEVISGGSRNDSTQSSGKGPERISLGHIVPSHQATRKGHEEVERNCTKGSWCPIDSSCCPDTVEFYDGNVTRCIKAPESCINYKQADDRKPWVVRRNVTRGTVRSKSSDSRSQHSQDTKCRASTDAMNNTRSICIVIAPISNHPSACAPTPCRINHPSYGTN